MVNSAMFEVFRSTLYCNQSNHGSSSRRHKSNNNLESGAIHLLEVVIRLCQLQSIVHLPNSQYFSWPTDPFQTFFLPSKFE